MMLTGKRMPTRESAMDAAIPDGRNSFQIIKKNGIEMLDFYRE